MDSRKLLKTTRNRLTQAGIKTAEIDALTIIEHVCTIDRAKLVAGVNLNNNQVEDINDLIRERVNRVPLAFLTKNKQFYGYDYYVDERVLIPRPESEDLVALALTIKLDENFNIIDLGCGSGCLGISYLLASQETSRHKLTLADISQQALQIAKINAKNHNVPAKFAHIDIMQSIKLDKYNLIFANLPYVDIIQKAKFEKESPELTREPQKALYAGNNGLEYYQSLFAKLNPSHNKFVITESLPSQHPQLDKLAIQAGYQPTKSQDLARLYTPF